ncbi:MAG: chromosomal replication initiator protein DnaA [Christensenellaceae bacterium]
MSENLNVEYLWDRILEVAEHTVVPKLSYTTWIKPLKPLSVMGRRIMLQAPSPMTVDTLSLPGNDSTTSLAAMLRSAIVSANVGLNDFALVYGDQIVEPDAADRSAQPDFEVMPLNKKFTFDSFVVGPTNKLVYSAALAVAETPAQEGYNPLYIYGKTGLGKTHLVQAIANRLLERRPAYRIIYTTSEKFLNEFTRSIAPYQKGGADRRGQFREHYRNVDMLIIDDIQFFAEKPKIQEEFFHTFNDLFSMGKQIILTSDENPDRIPELEERLRTRFRSGLLWEVLPPDEETKLAILRRKAMEKQVSLPDDVLHFLANDSGSDVRTLEGRVNKVIHASKLYEQEITLSLASLALDKAVPETESSDVVTAENVLSCVCQYYHVTKDQILSGNRKADLVKARQIACYLMFDIMKLPLVTIGKQMHRDHATVIYSKDKVIDLIRKNDTIAREVDDIRSRILKK